MKVRLLTKTEGVEGSEYYGKSVDEIIVGKARISSSREVNDLFKEPHKLLRHCILQQHWSVFDQAHLGIEITTSLSMGREYLRHSSIHPQEFSFRYSESFETEPIELRTQCKNNRQSSVELIDNKINNWLVKICLNFCLFVYKFLIKVGVSRETARFVLPNAMTTKLHMEGSIRSWITLLNARLHETAQKEARLIAQEIRDILIEQCPLISKALYNFEYAEQVHILERIVLEKYKVFDVVKKIKSLN